MYKCAFTLLLLLLHTGLYHIASVRAGFFDDYIGHVTQEQSKVANIELRLFVTIGNQSLSASSFDALYLSAGQSLTIDLSSSAHSDSSYEGALEYQVIASGGMPSWLTLVSAGNGVFVYQVARDFDTTEQAIFSVYVRDHYGNVSPSQRLTLLPLELDLSASQGSDDDGVYESGGGSIQLRATASNDTRGHYSWIETSGAGGVLSNANSATPSYDPPSLSVKTMLSFEVTYLSDTAKLTKSLEVTLEPSEGGGGSVGGLKAKAGDDIEVLFGENFSLDASGSTGEGLSYEWSIVGLSVTEGLCNSQGEVQNFILESEREKMRPSFTALFRCSQEPYASYSIILQLIVSDGQDFDHDNVTITVICSQNGCPVRAKDWMQGSLKEQAVLEELFINRTVGAPLEWQSFSQYWGAGYEAGNTEGVLGARFGLAHILDDNSAFHFSVGSQISRRKEGYKQGGLVTLHYNKTPGNNQDILGFGLHAGLITGFYDNHVQDSWNAKSFEGSAYLSQTGQVKGSLAGFGWKAKFARRFVWFFEEEIDSFLSEQEMELQAEVVLNPVQRGGVMPRLGLDQKGAWLGFKGPFAWGDIEANFRAGGWAGLNWQLTF